MAAGGVQHPGRDVLLVGSKYKRQEDGQNGLPPVSGSGNPVGGGVRAADDGRGTILPVETVSVNTLLLMQVGYGVGFTCSPPADVEREFNGRET